MSSFLIGVAAGVFLLAGVFYRLVLDTPDRKSAFSALVLPPARRAKLPAWLGGKPKVIAAETEAEILGPEKGSVPENFGNIRPLTNEETDLTTFGPEVHEFPDMKVPVTRFEDFNQRLFVYAPVDKSDAEWPETTSDDFPTLVTMSNDAMLRAVKERLRPRYRVIIDNYGYWAAASRLLEQDPDYTDPVVVAYLAIPLAQRPVVISRRIGLTNGPIIFMRYGFADFRVIMADLQLYIPQCLQVLLAALIADRNTWLWFSIARMRHAVIGKVKADQAEKNALEIAQFLEEQTARHKEGLGGNRYRSLWEARARFGKTAEAEAPPAETADEPQSAPEEQPA